MQPYRCPITDSDDCKSRDCELHYMDAPLRVACYGLSSITPHLLGSRCDDCPECDEKQEGIR